MKPMKIKRYGWKPDRPDHRDLWYRPPRHAAALPAFYDQRARWPLCFDQGDLGSCTANALAGVVLKRLIDEKKVPLAAANQPKYVPSRLFTYWNERYLEGTVKQDAGAEIRDGIKALATKGTCFEDLWPYIVSRFAQTPPTKCYSTAAQHKIGVYQRVDNTNLNALKTAVSAEEPVAIGFSVYESFESDSVAASGFVPMPGTREAMIGGHAVVIVGYNDTLVNNGYKGFFIVRNSWGSDWGDKGYFYIPYAYFTDPNLADDSWIVNTAA